MPLTINTELPKYPYRQSPLVAVCFYLLVISTNLWYNIMLHCTLSLHTVSA